MKSIILRMFCAVALIGALVGTQTAVAQTSARTPKPRQMTARPSVDHDAPSYVKTVSGDGTMTVRLRKNGLEFSGMPIDLQNLKLSGMVGEVAIPIHTIAGVRFPKKAGETSTVILHNGDSISGEVAIGQLKLVSEWGEAAVNITEIDYIVFRKDLAWGTASTLAGNRWTLSRTATAQASPVRASRAQLRQVPVSRNKL